MSALRLASLTCCAVLALAAAPSARADGTLRDYIIGAWSNQGPGQCSGTLMVFYASGAFADIKLGDGTVDDLGVWVAEGDTVTLTVGEAHLPKDMENATLKVLKADPNHADVTLTFKDGTTQNGTLDRCPR